MGSHRIVPFAAAFALALSYIAGGCSDEKDGGRQAAPAAQGALPQGIAAATGAETVSMASLDREAPSAFAKRLLLAQRLQAIWIDRELRKRNITVSRTELDRHLQKTFHLVGQRVAPDVARAARRELARSKLAEDVLTEALPVTEQDLRDYFRRHRQTFRIPESRRITMITTDSRAVAAQAKAALDRGASWSDVAARYSSDAQGRVNGGTQDGMVKGSHLAPFDKVVFAAAKQQVTGPVKNGGRWALIKVIVISRGFQRTLDESRSGVIPAAQDEKRKDQLERMYEQLLKTYRRKTVCAPNLRVPECRNGPKESAQYVG